MSLTNSPSSARGQTRRDTRPRAASKVLRRSFEFDKVTLLAVLAASAIFAPVAIAILKRAAQIFAH